MTTCTPKVGICKREIISQLTSPVHNLCLHSKIRKLRRSSVCISRDEFVHARSTFSIAASGHTAPGKTSCTYLLVYFRTCRETQEHLTPGTMMVNRTNHSQVNLHDHRLSWGRWGSRIKSCARRDMKGQSIIVHAGSTSSSWTTHQPSCRPCMTEGDSVPLALMRH